MLYVCSLLKPKLKKGKISDDIIVSQFFSLLHCSGLLSDEQVQAVEAKVRAGQARI